jgi:dTDP-glucose 4,6-dehydratase
MKEKTRVLLTGAGGAIGIHMLAHIFHNTDWEVVATDSFRHKGYPDRIALLFVEHPEWRERLEVIVHDLNAPFTEREMKKMGNITHIINLASISDVQASIDDPVPTVRNNVELMLNMLELARAIKPKTFLHFSTDEVYGPVTKESKGHKEWASIKPSNPYSASKAAQEAIAFAWWRSFDVPLIITNTMNNFGETQAPSKFPAMIQNCLQHNKPIPIHVAKNGEIGTRHYIHSRNAADAVLFILNNIPVVHHKPLAIDEPLRFNITGDLQIDNLELVKIIATLMGKEYSTEMVNFHEANPGHDLHYGLDGTALKEAGWKSPLSFEESMKNTIDWQTANLEWL